MEFRSANFGVLVLDTISSYVDGQEKLMFDKLKNRSTINNANP